jgi:hypothetical protein
MMSVKDLRDVFARMSEETGWDVGGDLLWGFFFTDRSREPLDLAAPILQVQGYRVVDIYRSDSDEAGEQDLWWLHVESVGVHTPESLFARGERLAEFAKAHGIGAYDGWDVGPVGEAATGKP